MPETILKNKIHDIFRNIADEFKDFSVDKLPSGTNGPHNDKTNNLRIASHLLIIYVSLYKYFKHAYLKEYIRIILLHIFSFQDKNYLYINRKQFGKDPYNGLIGQVWVIESLLFSKEFLGPGEINKYIIKPLTNITYSKKNKVWYIKFDNKKLFNYTLNQNIWILNILIKVNEFLNIELYKDNISHQISYIDQLLFPLQIEGSMLPLTCGEKKFFSWYNLLQVKKIYKLFTYTLNPQLNKKIREGYTPFSLLGILSCNQLKKKLLNNKIKKIIESLSYNIDKLDKSNPYLYGYNVAHIEIAICSHYLTHPQQDIIESKLDNMLFAKPDFIIKDYTTFIARHYELYHFLKDQ